MNFYRNNWYYIGGILFIIFAFMLGIFGEQVGLPRTILLLSFMAMLIHQFEEYALPGGFPAIWNIVVSKETEKPNRYPLNKQSSLMVNTFCIYPVYILPILFPEWYWLGITTMLLAFAQLVVHGIVIPKKLKSFYNPGLAAVIFLQIPISLYYFWYIQTNFSFAAWHWWVGILCIPFTAFLTIFAPIAIFKDKNSPYPWSKAEMERFPIKK